MQQAGLRTYLWHCAGNEPTFITVRRLFIYSAFIFPKFRLATIASSFSVNCLPRDWASSTALWNPISTNS